MASLNGAWLITGRKRDGNMVRRTPGDRKTMKILSSSRFQWIAFNTATGKFSGTGGGSYTAENGNYTEHIEFFSRDNSRVGAELSFQYEVWAATVLGIHFRRGLVGSTIKQSSLKYAIMQSEVVPGVDAIAPHSKIFPICKASPGS